MLSAPVFGALIVSCLRARVPSQWRRCVGCRHVQRGSSKRIRKRPRSTRRQAGPVAGSYYIIPDVPFGPRDPPMLPTDPDRPAAPESDATLVRPLDEQARLAASTTSPVVPGFAIQDILGRGATGVVYRATQTGLNRPVAAQDAAGRSVRRPELTSPVLARGRVGGSRWSTRTSSGCSSSVRPAGTRTLRWNSPLGAPWPTESRRPARWPRRRRRRCWPSWPTRSPTPTAAGSSTATSNRSTCC